MKTFFFAILVASIAFSFINAQTYSFQPKEEGIVASYRIDYSEQLDFKQIGYGIEGGYYFLKGLGTNWAFSFDMRFAYSKSERYVTGSYFDGTYIFIIPIGKTTYREGYLSSNSGSLAVPIKFRALFSNNSPVFISFGATPVIHFHTENLYEFRERGGNNGLTGFQSTDVKQFFFSGEPIVLGLGVKLNRLMLEADFSLGIIPYEDDYITSLTRLSFVFSAYYNLKNMKNDVAQPKMQ